MKLLELLFKTFMAVAVIIFAGCQKQDPNQSGKGEGGKVILTVTIGDITKIGLEGKDTQGIKLTWITGDQGTAPALWSYTGTFDGRGCFAGAGKSTVSIINYDDIH